MRKITPDKDSYMLGGSTAMKKKESEPRYPTIRIDTKHIPEAMDWKVGKTYTVNMKLKMIGISQSRYDNSAEFEIREIEPEGSKDSEESEE